MRTSEVMVCPQAEAIMPEDSDFVLERRVGAIVATVAMAKKQETGTIQCPDCLGDMKYFKRKDYSLLARCQTTKNCYAFII